MTKAGGVSKKATPAKKRVASKVRILLTQQLIDHNSSLININLLQFVLASIKAF